jgi:putative transposase
VFVALEIGSRRLIHFNATEHPTAEWTLLSAGLDEEIERWGIAVLKSPAHAPMANAFCERLIGTIRRECLNYVMPLNESHLKRTLREWVRHYNSGRPHPSLGPGIPDQVERTLPADDKHN